MYLAFCFIIFSQPYHSILHTTNSSTEYVYIEDLTKEFSLVMGMFRYLGTLDVTGRFIPDLKYTPQKCDSNSMGGASSPSKPWLLDSQNGEKLYEYHAGRLVPGVIKPDSKQQNGTFVPWDTTKPVAYYFYPDLDGKIIEMKDYLKDYDPAKSPRIYNLPGRIVKKGNAK